MQAHRFSRSASTTTSPTPFHTLFFITDSYLFIYVLRRLIFPYVTPPFLTGSPWHCDPRLFPVVCDSVSLACYARGSINSPTASWRFHTAAVSRCALIRVASASHSCDLRASSWSHSSQFVVFTWVLPLRQGSFYVCFPYVPSAHSLPFRWHATAPDAPLSNSFTWLGFVESCANWGARLNFWIQVGALPPSSAGSLAVVPYGVARALQSQLDPLPMLFGTPCHSAGWSPDTAWYVLVRFLLGAVNGWREVASTTC